MTRSDPQNHARAEALAAEIITGIQQGHAPEWVEEVLGSALLEVVRNERERCAVIAERRAELWGRTVRRVSDGAWPGAAVTEARERRKEAIVIADAIRADDLPPN